MLAGWCGRSRPFGAAAQSAPPPSTFEVNDSHFHLTNYIQEGTNVQDFLNIMGTKVGRVALFGIPLQQQWSYGNTGDFAPTYYLQTDAPLYYYSFTDAFIAMAYRSLPPAEQARFDPMITGFNPADMYAADHIRRVLTTFPGVFSGIGEFTIHKEFVSSKIAGETASLTNPALDRLLDFAGEVGLVALIHNDIDMPFPEARAGPVSGRAAARAVPASPEDHDHLGALRARPRRAAGEGSAGHHRPRAVESRAALTSTSTSPGTRSPSTSSHRLRPSRRPPALINRHPDRFLFGTDEVAPTDQTAYLKVYHMYAPLFAQLTPEASEKVRKGNYERLFDEARRRVRAWEKANVTERPR